MTACESDENIERILTELKAEIVDNLDYSGELTDRDMYQCIDRALVRKQELRCLPVTTRAELRKSIFDSLRRLDVLQELLDDDGVTEIMVNGTRAIFVERGGHITQWDKRFSSVDKLEDVIQQIVSGVNRTVNTASPIVDARLADGSRVNVVLPPVALDGPILTIRRFPADAIRMEQLIQWGSITEEAAAFLLGAVRAGYNIFVSGGTGSGKTTFLNVLSTGIDVSERVITIEDSAELQLDIPNLVRLEARSANLEGTGEITIRTLIRTALRMRPDRLIVGEVRGAEALDMLQAMNTGHDGSLSTGHANSPSDMLSRIETMALQGGDLPLEAIRSQIGSAIDLIVHLGRFRDGSRHVLRICEVIGRQDAQAELRDLFTYEQEVGLVRTGNLENLKKWNRCSGLPNL